MANRQKGSGESDNPQKFLNLDVLKELDEQNNAGRSGNGSSATGEIFKETIERDIHRTFPTHRLFLDETEDEEHDQVKRRGSSRRISFINKAGSSSTPDLITATGGQASLRRVLRAYSVIDPEVGYCQGMNFISASFLTFLTEEESFWLLESVMDESPCKMRGLFGSGMAQAQEVLYIADKVFKQLLPKLYDHFERENVLLSMYATQWLLTMYTSNFPFELVTRVWDCFLFEGWKIAYRVMLGILKVYEKELMDLEFEGILGFLKELPAHVDATEVMKTTFAIPLKTNHITKYQLEYNTKNGGGNSNESRPK